MKDVLARPGAGTAWPKPVYAWYVVLVLTATYMMAYIDRSVLGLLVELIRADLQISDTQVSLLGGAAFAIFYVAMGMPLGRLADRANRRNMIAISTFVWGCMTAACGLANNFWQLFMARVGVGVGESALPPAALSVISDYFSPEKRSAPLATFMVAIAVGSGLAYVVGGAIIDWVTSIPEFALPIVGAVRPWQAVFIMVGAPSLILMLFVMTFREPVRRGLRPSKMQEAGKAADTVPVREVMNFVFKENRETFGAVFIAFGGFALHSVALQLWLPAYYIRRFGWTEVEIGLAFGVIILVFATAGMLTGAKLASWMKKRGHADAVLRAPLYMSLVMTPAAIVATLLPDPYISLIVVAPVMGISYGLFALVPEIMHAITPNQMRGQVTAIFIFFNNVVGVIVGGTFVALITDYVFADEAAVGYSLALTAGTVLPASAYLVWRGLKHFRVSVAAADEWLREYPDEEEASG